MTNAKDQTEFVWLATESAPHNFPMKIMRASSFIYHGSESDGLYIPSGGTLYRGWGSAIGCYIEGTSKQYFFVVRFDEKELYAAFDKLGGTEELVNIEIEPHFPKNQTKVRLQQQRVGGTKELHV